MRSVIKTFGFILIFAMLSVALFGCIKLPCLSHTDSDEDGKCDKCDKTLDTSPEDDGSVVLIDEWGVATFQIVVGNDVDDNTERLLSDLVRDLKRIGIEIKVVSDDEENIKDCEVLIGDVKSRGEEYTRDKHLLGKDGYFIKLEGTKVLINAGSENTLFSAVKIFISEILGFNENVKDLDSVIMKKEDSQENVQNNYSITSLSVNGVSVSGYTIAADTSISYYKEAAEYLQDVIYGKTGYWLDIVPVSEADKSIIIKEIPKKTGDGSFKVSANADNQLLIECAYYNRILDSVISFCNSKISSASGDVDFKNTVMSLDVSVVYYEDFGARGDGRTNDFAAIKKAHDTANECGQTVKSKNPTKAKYYISDAVFNSVVESIIIKTNVDWGGAEFIIDDSLLECKSTSGPHYVHIFKVEPDYEKVRITDKEILDKIIRNGLNSETEKIDLGLGYPAMLVPNDASHTVYRRKGYGGYRGYPMSELVVIDKDGNVDRETSLMFDYVSLDYIDVYRIDEKPITIENATITTVVSKFNTVYTDPLTNKKDSYDSNYFKRGIEVARSNTTLKNIKHYVEGEFTLDEQAAGKIGVCYYGFFSIVNTNNVTLDSCVLTGRRCFWRGIAWQGGSGTQGTYDMQVSFSNKTVFKKCTQSNFWVNDDAEAVEKGTPGAKLSISNSSKFANRGAFVKMYWGLGGSNDCKNMEFHGSVLSRFDAHRGLYNGKIINSAVTGISLTGGGKMILENVEWYSPHNGRSENGLVILRDDYGSTWKGDILIKNIKAYPDPNKAGSRYYNMWLASHQYTNWDFGYTCYFPNISIDGFTVYDRTTITKNNPTGDIIPPDKINVLLTTKNYSFDAYYGEPNLHLPTTLNKHPFFNVPGEQNGVEDKTSYENLNPIVPPEYIILKNFGGHNLIFQTENVTTFLDNTYIKIEDAVINDPENN